jgi:phosphoribosyl 1,2-cyclic phosphate phosphodiesterase
MLGEQIRVDLGPDSFYHQQRYALAYERVEALVMTHGHEDHWLAHELHYRRPGFSVVPENSLLTVYGNARVERELAEVTGGDLSRHRLRFERVTPFQPFALPGGVCATALPADHDRTQDCFNYLFEVPSASAIATSDTERRTPNAQCRVLIGHDSGWWEEPAWEFAAGKPIDVALLDCTGGPLETRRGHMSCSVVCEFRDRLRDLDALAPGARVIATHFSHNGGWLHHQLEAYLNPRGVEVAFDGMFVAL